MGGTYGEVCTKKSIYQREWRLCGAVLYGLLPPQASRPELHGQAVYPRAELDFVVDEAVDVAEVFLYRPNLSAEGMTLRSFFEMIFRKKFPIIKAVPPEPHPEHLRMLHVRK